MKYALNNEAVSTNHCLLKDSIEPSEKSLLFFAETNSNATQMPIQLLETTCGMSEAAQFNRFSSCFDIYWLGFDMRCTEVEQICSCQSSSSKFPTVLTSVWRTHVINIFHVFPGHFGCYCNSHKFSF